MPTLYYERQRQTEKLLQIKHAMHNPDRILAQREIVLKDIIGTVSEI